MNVVRTLMVAIVFGLLQACTTTHLGKSPSFQDLSDVPRARVDADRPNLGLDLKPHYNSDLFASSLNESGFFSSVKSGAGVKEDLVLNVSVKRKNSRGFWRSIHYFVEIITASIVPYATFFEETWIVAVENREGTELAKYEYKFNLSSHVSAFPFVYLFGTSDRAKIRKHQFTLLTNNIIKGMHKDDVFSKLETGLSDN